MPTGRYGLQANVVDGKIYLIGGFCFGASMYNQYASLNEVYDPLTDTWATKSSALAAVGLYASAVCDGKIYVIGGRVCSVFVVATNTDMVEEYDPATDSWGLPKGRMPFPRSGTAAAVYGGKIYVAGGEYLDNNYVGAFREVAAFDPATNQWTNLPPLQVPRHGMIGGFVGKRFHVISGHIQSGAVFGDPMDSNENNAFELP